MDFQQKGKEVYRDMDQWTEIRQRVLREGISKRQIMRETGMHWETLKKILEHSSPPGYKRSKLPKKPKISNVIRPRGSGRYYKRRDSPEATPLSKTRFVNCGER
jgi:hypothetical protein